MIEYDPPQTTLGDLQENFRNWQRHIADVDYLELKLQPWGTDQLQWYIVMGHLVSSSSSVSSVTPPGLDCNCIELYDTLAMSSIGVLTEGPAGTWSTGGDTIVYQGSGDWRYLGVDSNNGSAVCPVTCSWGDIVVINCSSSSSSTSASGGDSGISSSSGKAAITPYRDRYITWYCGEEPVPMFRDTFEVTLNKKGFGALRLPSEFVQSVDPDTLRVTSIVPDQPSYTCGTILKRGELWAVFIRTKKMGLFSRKASTAVVRVHGQRKDAPTDKWGERNFDQFLENETFWRQAFLFQ